jgi:hypothetical protein
MKVITRELAARFAPVVSFHPHERFFPCSIDWLLERSQLRKRDDPGFLLVAPQQSALAEFNQGNYYLDVGAEAYAGAPLDHQHVTAPMYVAAQEWDDCIEITYVMLYAYQGGQTCRGQIGEHFHAIANNYGIHQGDLEWVAVRVSKDYEKLLSVGYAAHGHVTWYAPEDCLMDGQHPLVRAALNGHASHNGKNKNPEDWVYSFELPEVFGITDLFADNGPTWAPHRQPERMLAIIGLDDGKPVSDQVWARFRGRLGKREDVSFVNATRLDGTALRLDQIVVVHTIVALGKVLKLIPEDLREGIGPEGPGARDFVQGLRRQGAALQAA